VHVLKTILIGLGGVFLALIALLAWLGAGSAHFRTQQEPFVKTFVTDLSKRWEVADVYDRLANSFIEQAGTTQGLQLLRQFRQLGALKFVRDFELRNYNSGPNGQTGVFTFKGTFEHGEAVVAVEVTKVGGAVHVLGFNVTGTTIRDYSTQTRSEA
jgi:hypothetical protein